jgi:hypothetical protein
VYGLGITRVKWTASKAAWTSRLSQLGYFTFRTYMNTEKISRDQIGMQIRDVKGNVARPVGYSLLAYEADVTIIP